MDFCVICEKHPAEKFCQDCQSRIDSDLYAGIEYDAKLSFDNLVYRTGRVFWLELRVFDVLLETASMLRLVEDKLIYIPDKLGKLLENFDTSDPSA